MTEYYPSIVKAALFLAAFLLLSRRYLIAQRQTESGPTLVVKERAIFDRELTLYRIEISDGEEILLASSAKNLFLLGSDRPATKLQTLRGTPAESDTVLSLERA